MTKLPLLQLAYEAFSHTGSSGVDRYAPPHTEAGSVGGSLQEFLSDQLKRLDCCKPPQPTPAMRPPDRVWRPGGIPEVPLTLPL